MEAKDSWCMNSDKHRINTEKRSETEKKANPKKYDADRQHFGGLRHPVAPSVHPSFEESSGVGDLSGGGGPATSSSSPWLAQSKEAPYSASSRSIRRSGPPGPPPVAVVLASEAPGAAGPLPGVLEGSPPTSYAKEHAPGVEPLFTGGNSWGAGFEAFLPPPQPQGQGGDVVGRPP